MSASNKPVDPRVEVVARTIAKRFNYHWTFHEVMATEIIRALDEYEARKK